MHQYQPEGSFDWQLAKEARTMGKVQLRKFKEELSINPNNLAVRRLLFEKYNTNTNHIKTILPHLIWFIDNHPKHAALQFLAWARIDNVYKTARKHWIAKIRSQKDDVTILCHAAEFVQINEPLLAVKFLKKASETDIFDEELPRRLSNLFRLKALTCPSRAKYYCRKAAEQMKIALARYAVPSEEHSYLKTYFTMEINGLAEVALKVNLLKEASDFAQIMLRHGEINELRLRIRSDLTSPIYERSAHSAHAILTVVALREKRIEEAKEHLLIMKSLTNDQQPNDAIVRELVVLRRHELALDYLWQIHEYWKSVIEGQCEDYRAGTNKKYAEQMEKSVRMMINRARKDFRAS